ncbi:hypothetical protein [Microbispora sp. GKU 823]|uniref:hypothetical protein n=1 Tax=Microbispora sp. GKU 823 TaxID=1652100 RepID=UPI0015C47671|nr:hypothetical protein [Microbispora sp. GKU 823]
MIAASFATASRCLRGVLTPFTSTQNVALSCGGIDLVEVVHRHLPFEGYLCIKEVAA